MTRHGAFGQAGPGNPGAPRLSAEQLAVLQEAAEWFAQLRSGHAADAEHRRWQAWLDASAAHRDAWRRVESINARFERLPGQLANEALATSQRGRRRALKVLALGAACLASGSLVQTPPARRYLAALAAGYRTSVGEIRRVELADGTPLWLNTASAFDPYPLAAGQRGGALLEGEILVDASRPGAGPFAVDIAATRLRGFDARFAVRRLDDGIRVQTYAGAVEIGAGAPGAPRRVEAGWQCDFGPDRITESTRCDETGAAWTRRMLIADNMPLGAFIAELARYRRGYLSCASSVASLRLVGAFPLDDTDRVLDAVQASLPVRARHRLPWVTVVEPVAESQAT